MNQSTNITLSNGEVLQVLQQIEAHLAALRQGAAAVRPEWLTVEEVAKELRLSRDSVERLIACGRLQAAEVTGVPGRGHRRRYRVLREWIELFLKTSANRQETNRTTRRSFPRKSSTIDFIQ